jgi:drug/metabolite transporter (DMT)-like permease
MVFVASAMFAVNGTMSKLVLRAGFDAPQLTLLRAAGAFLGLMLLSLVLRPGPRRLRVRPREIPLLVVFGVSGFYLVPMLYFVAISRMPVGIALLFEYTAPLLVALWARFGQRQQVRPRLWGGLALSLGGLACVAEVWGELRLDGLGVAAGFGAAVLLAFYYVLGARGVEQRDSVSLTTYAFGAAAVTGLLVRAVTEGTGGWEPLTRSEAGVPVALLCCYVVIFGSIVPYTLLAAAMRHLPATSVGILGMVEPVLAATVAWITLGAGEALNAAQLAGGVLVLAGVTLAETARTAPKRPIPGPPDVVLEPDRAGRGP